MPRVQYSAELPGSPVGCAEFQPGEVREVSSEEAARLARNVHFTLLPDATEPPAPHAAPEA